MFGDVQTLVGPPVGSATRDDWSAVRRLPDAGLLRRHVRLARTDRHGRRHDRSRPRSGWPGPAVGTPLHRRSRLVRSV